MAFRLRKLYGTGQSMVHAFVRRYGVVPIRLLPFFHTIFERLSERSSMVPQQFWFGRVVPDVAVSEQFPHIRLSFRAVLVSTNQ